MQPRKKRIPLWVFSALAATTALAQVNYQNPNGVEGANTIALSTNAPPPIPAPATVLASAFNLLPAWDKSNEQFANVTEVAFQVSSMWKTISAAGSTPYASMGATYFFTRQVGVQGEIVTLGNGQGNNEVDSGSTLLEFRRGVGNIAGYLLGGGGYDFNLHRWNGQGGLGIEYRYNTGLGIFADTRICVTGSEGDKNGFMTRVGMTLHF